MVEGDDAGLGGRHMMIGGLERSPAWFIVVPQQEPCFNSYFLLKLEFFEAGIR